MDALIIKKIYYARALQNLLKSLETEKRLVMSRFRWLNSRVRSGEFDGTVLPRQTEDWGWQ
jgi:hypothetical protein